MGINKLFFKSLNNAITNQTKIGGFTVPKGAVSFDYVSGSAKKGNFQTYSFKNKKGKLLYRETTYYNNGEKTRTSRSYNYDNGAKSILEYKSDGSGIIQEINLNSTRAFRSKQDDSVFYMHSKETINADGEKFVFCKLKAGETPKGVEFSPAWDGSAPELKYINTDKKYTGKNQEYLPLIFSTATNLTDKKVKQISAIQEQLYGLKGITPPVKRINRQELCQGFQYGALGATSPQNGQICIADDVNDPEVLATILGHEYKHASDFSNISRCKDPKDTPEKLDKLFKEAEVVHPGSRNFYEKSVAKGQFEEGSNIYKFFQKIYDSFIEAEKQNSGYKLSLEAHDQFLLEQRANKAGAREADKFTNSMKDFFNFVAGLV